VREPQVLGNGPPGRSSIAADAHEETGKFALILIPLICDRQEVLILCEEDAA